MEPASAYFLERGLEVSEGATDRHVSVTILIADEADINAYSYYEIAAKNVGLAVRMFLNEDHAIAWLRELMVAGIPSPRRVGVVSPGRNRAHA